LVFFRVSVTPLLFLLSVYRMWVFFSLCGEMIWWWVGLVQDSLGVIEVMVVRATGLYASDWGKSSDP
jgi:hypothetical protein